MLRFHFIFFPFVDIFPSIRSVLFFVATVLPVVFIVLVSRCYCRRQKYENKTEKKKNRVDEKCNGGHVYVICCVFVYLFI